LEKNMKMTLTREEKELLNLDALYRDFLRDVERYSSHGRH